MRAGFKALEGMSLNLFSDDELDEIHQATLRVLKETGVRVLAEDAQDYFHGGGCEVDRAKSIVKIPVQSDRHPVTFCWPELILQKISG